jgi:hypothetical protein
MRSEPDGASAELLGYARYLAHSERREGPQEPPQASARGEAQAGGPVARFWSYIPLTGRYPDGGRQPRPTLIRAAAREGWVAQGTLPRSQAHLRHGPVVGRDAPQGGTGDARAREYFSDYGHVQPRLAGHAGQGEQRDGERLAVACWCKKDRELPWPFSRTLVLPANRGIPVARSAGLEPATF